MDLGPAPDDLRPGLWVLSRALCSFTTVRLPPGLSRSRRRDAVRLRARADAPFAELDFVEHWSGDTIAVWMWDRARVWRAIEHAGLDPSRVRVLPETVLQAQPGSDGLRLVEALDGVDAQVWQDGTLLGSRWFASLPDDGDLLLFLRGCGRSADDATRPALQQPGWLQRAWLAGPSSFAWTQISLRQAVAAIALLAALPVAWRAGEAVALGLADARLARVQARDAASLGDLEQARRRALADLDAAQAVASLDRFPSQLTLLAEITRRLPQDAFLSEWSFQAGELSFTATAPDAAIDLPATVRALSELKLLQSVVADRTLDGRGVAARGRVRGAP